MGLSCSHVISPTSPQADCCPIDPILAVRHSTRIPPHTHALKRLHTSPRPAVAASSGHAVLLMSGQGLWGLFRVAWSGCAKREWSRG